jgi:rRNA maturation protein Rpf1
MNIGIFSKHNFNIVDDAVNYIIENILVILGTVSIPKDIVFLYVHAPHSEYSTKIYKYVHNYILINHNEVNEASIRRLVYEKLEDIGFERNIKNES